MYSLPPEYQNNLLWFHIENNTQKCQVLLPSRVGMILCSQWKIVLPRPKHIVGWLDLLITLIYFYNPGINPSQANQVCSGNDPTPPYSYKDNPQTSSLFHLLLIDLSQVSSSYRYPKEKTRKLITVPMPHHIKRIIFHSAICSLYRICKAFYS